MLHLIRIYVRSPYLLILTEFSSTPPLVPSDSVSPDGRSKIFPAFTDSDITADCEGWHPIICIKINSWVGMSRVYFSYFRSPSQSHIFPLRATNNKTHTHNKALKRMRMQWLGGVFSCFQNQVISHELQTQATQASKSHGLKIVEFFWKASNRMVNQQDICVWISFLFEKSRVFSTFLWTF